jgi:zinc transport system ATP-binding protein
MPDGRAVHPGDADVSPLVATRGLGFRREGQRILWDVDFAVRPGEIVTVVGPNGSGKTTLMRLLIGAEMPTVGRIERRPGLRIGYVPQRLAVDYTMPMTVRRFLALSGGTADEGAHALERVGIPDLGDRQMRALSGGQFQRALLAQALMRRPHLLVLDEAAQGLDQPGTARFYELVGELRRELGCGVVMVGHDLHVVMAASDRVVCLNGHVCCEGSPTVVSAAPEYRALFGLGTRGAFALYRHEHDHVHAEHVPGAAGGDAGAPSDAGAGDADGEPRAG